MKFMNCERYLVGAGLNWHGRPDRDLLVNPKHLEWIRSRPCAVTKQERETSSFQIDPHHVQYKSQGHNDFTAIPLRHDLHMELHQIREHAFEDKYCIDLKDVLIAALTERIIELERNVGRSS